MDDKSAASPAPDPSPATPAAGPPGAAGGPPGPAGTAPATARPAPFGADRPGARPRPPRFRLEPGPESARLPPAAVVAGVVAAALVAGGRPGIGVTLAATVVAVPVVLAARRGRGRTDRTRTVLAVLALALPVVATVRASEWLAWSCLAAAACLGAAVVLDARRWTELAALPLLVVRSVQGVLPLAGRGVRAGTAGRIEGPALAGLGIGGVLTVAVGVLLATGDQAFAEVLLVLRPSLDPGTALLRTLVFAVAALAVLAGGFAVRARVHVPRPEHVRIAERAVWLIPVLLVTATVGLFLLVQLATLFPGHGLVRGTTHAARAREGFGQLVAVTLIVLGLLGWAGAQASRGGERDRRWMTAAGGTLLACALLLAASALRRLALYQDAYGWTVTRVNAWAFELWLVLVLLAVAAGWLARRTDLVPRIVAGSAGLGLLVVALAGPDAIAARGDVHRFERTGVLDVAYLSQLSDDAVPALMRLPEPQRGCVLAGRVTGDGWTSSNLARARAAELLPAGHPGEACLG